MRNRRPPVSLFRRAWDAISRNDFAEPARKREYDGAKTGRRTDGWSVVGSSSADGEIGASLATMRDRARDLCRNNPLAKRIVDVLTTLIVGDGIVGTPNTGDAALDARVLELWEAWQAECDSEGDFDFAGMQDLAIRSMLESGEVLCRFRGRRLSDGLTIPLQLQMIEPDLIDGSQNGIIDGDTVRLGVRYDGLDRRSAYYLYRTHPGDTVNFDRSVSLVPASEVMHLFVKTRPGQSRGVTWLAPVMVAVRDLGDMQDAMLFREKINACITNYITRAEGYEGEDDPETDSQGRTISTVEPGVSTNLRPGEEVVDAKTPGAESKYTEFVQTSERFIAIGAGLTYDQLTGDMTQANFSSLKAADRIQRRQITAFQWKLAIPRFCQPVWDRFIEEAVALRKLPDRGEAGYPVRWLPPSHEPVDRVDDLDADILEMSVGLKTWSQAVQERGWAPPDQAKDVAADKEMLAKLGIDLGPVVQALAARRQATSPTDGQPARPPLKVVGG